MKELVFTSTAFALFVVCPRMAGMMHVINKHSQSSILATILIGTIVSVPLLLLMVFAFNKFGVWGALAFCVLTDLGSVLIIKEVGFRAGLETFYYCTFCRYWRKSGSGYL